ncbi:hypothetical protein LMG3441_00655 [Achromobacter kerstersii]|uniref:TniQ n=2 Tax=Achromobacter kerstersii TaxID=1353890 RepID=A0A6S6Z8F3_9BURK|nr:hypothetical protein LMG3441_00655 [Achromobacter kerstersii]
MDATAKQVLSWAQGWHRPFESHVSLAWRLRMENVLSPAELKNMLPKAKKKKFPTYEGFLFEIRSIEGLLGIRGKIYSPVSEGDIFQRDNDAFLCQKHLRVCPMCMERGYHSVLHQIMCIRSCPIHNQPLTRYCPSCIKPFTAFGLLSTTLGSPWSCRYCKWPHAGNYPRPVRRDPNFEELQRAGSSVAEWISSISRVINDAGWHNDYGLMESSIDRGRAVELASIFEKPPDAIKKHVYHNTGLHIRPIFAAPSDENTEGKNTSEDIRAAYEMAHRRITAETPALCIKGTRAERSEWEWDICNRCFAPIHYTFAPERLAYRWWVTAFEGPQSDHLHAAPGTRENIQYVVHPRAEIVKLFATSRSNLAEYFYFSFYAYLNISIALQTYFYISTFKGKKKKGVALQEIWHAFAPISHIKPSSSTFPLQCMRCPATDSTDHPIAILFWLDIIPRRALIDSRNVKS